MCDEIHIDKTKMFLFIVTIDVVRNIGNLLYFFMTYEVEIFLRMA